MYVMAPQQTAQPVAHRPYRPSRLMRWLLRLGDRIAVGTIRVVMPDGSRHRFVGTEPGPDAELHIHNDRLARRFLIAGSLGFCEAYIDGDWSSPDVDTLFVFFLLNRDHLGRVMAGKPWFRATQHLLHAMRPNSRRGARRNIAEHYDLGNAFYERWLDPTMTYSSAIFAPGISSLDAAQRRKYTLLADRLQLGRDDHVLEIGCGWGGFAEFAASEIGARVTGITISQEQHDYARRRVFEAGLAERVDILLRDYRDVDGQFDRVASIEMFEAVGESYWPQFFQTVRDRLARGGAAALQIITISDRHFEHYRRGADYIQRYIFPGGMLPSKQALGQQLDRAGLKLREMVGFGEHYARTLREWNRQFQAAWPEIQTLGFDARFKRMWEQYLHYCAAGFQIGTIDVVQVAAQRD